jgi:hypothetical protein
MSARPQTFVLTLVARPGTDSIKALRALLKLAWRRFGLRCTAVEEVAASAPNHQKEA